MWKEKKETRHYPNWYPNWLRRLWLFFHVPLFCWIKLHGGFLSHGGTPNFMGLNSIGTILWPFQLHYSYRMFSRCYNPYTYIVYIYSNLWAWNSHGYNHSLGHLYLGYKARPVCPSSASPRRSSWRSSRGSAHPVFVISSNRSGAGVAARADKRRLTYVYFHVHDMIYILCIYIHIMIYHDISRYIMTYHDISDECLSYIHILAHFLDIGFSW